jgi:hypothetical protein
MEVFNLPAQNKTLKQIIAELDDIMQKHELMELADCINALSELEERHDS